VTRRAHPNYLPMLISRTETEELRRVQDPHCFRSRRLQSPPPTSCIGFQLKGPAVTNRPFGAHGLGRQGALNDWLGAHNVCLSFDQGPTPREAQGTRLGGMRVVAAGSSVDRSRFLTPDLRSRGCINQRPYAVVVMAGQRRSRPNSRWAPTSRRTRTSALCGH
jgi:hypothetical protein